ncbi:uncharacterized protein [Antedon mediterranea]|uniref:uncharacterized protein n=1 Tax=Antedon mediterranea TaxID=105859 RepID=UPI003AF90FDE
MAKREDKDPVRKFVENLTECSLCFEEEMDQPKFLTCGHSFCLKCLQKQCDSIATNQRQQTVSDIVCALCRKSTQLPSTGLKTLPSSFLVEDAKGCLKTADSLGLTKVRLPMCENSDHNQVLNIWCETCLELICIRCRNQQLHRRHNVSHMTFIEAFQKYRTKKYKFEKKLSAMEKAFTDSRLVQSQCQKDYESSVSEINKLKKEKKNITKRANREQQMHKKIIEKHHQEIESMVDKIKSIEIQNSKISECAQTDLEKHKMILESYQKQMEKIQSEKQELQRRLEIQNEMIKRSAIAEGAGREELCKFKTRKETFVHDTENTEREIRTIWKSRPTKKEIEELLESYKKTLKNVQSENHELQQKIKTQIGLLVDEIDRTTERNAISERAERDTTGHKMTLEGCKNKLQNVQSENIKLQFQLKIEIESMIDEIESTEKERCKIAERAEKDMEELKLILDLYQNELDKVRFELCKIKDRCHSLVTENDILKVKVSKTAQSAQRDRTIVETQNTLVKKLKSEKHTFQTNMESVIMQRNELVEQNQVFTIVLHQHHIHIRALEIEQNKSRQRERILTSNQGTLLIIFIIFCLYCLYEWALWTLFTRRRRRLVVKLSENLKQKMAKREDKDPIRTFVENLTECSLCFEEMDQPKFLTCGHSFCLNCLQKQCDSIATNQRHRTVSNIVCALCRKSTQLPSTGLKTLPSSFLVEDAKGCLKTADSLGLTKVRLPMCENSDHNQVLNIWCETCLELICIRCHNQQLHRRHNVSHVTFIEAFHKYRTKKYKFENKHSEMEKAFTDLRLVQSQCQKDYESSVSEIDKLKKEKKDITKRANREQKIHKNIIEKHRKEIESMVEKIKDIEIQKSTIAECAQNDMEKHKMILESYQKDMEKIQSEKQEIQKESNYFLSLDKFTPTSLGNKIGSEIFEKLAENGKTRR